MLKPKKTTAEATLAAGLVGRYVWSLSKRMLADLLHDHTYRGLPQMRYDTSVEKGTAET